MPEENSAGLLSVSDTRHCPMMVSNSVCHLIVPDNWVRSKINFLVGPQEPLLAIVESQKLAWFEHVTCRDSLSKTILQGTFDGGQHCGQPRKCLMDNIKEWTSLPITELLTRASYRKDLESWLKSSLRSP